MQHNLRVYKMSAEKPNLKMYDCIYMALIIKAD